MDSAEPTGFRAFHGRSFKLDVVFTKRALDADCSAEKRCRIVIDVDDESEPVTVDYDLAKGIAASLEEKESEQAMIDRFKEIADQFGSDRE
jgi:hypothetical protein